MIDYCFLLALFLIFGILALFEFFFGSKDTVSEAECTAKLTIVFFVISLICLVLVIVSHFWRNSIIGGF